MNSLTNHLITSIWPEIAENGLEYKTPDDQLGSPFTVVGSDNSCIKIETAGGNPITIQRESFTAAIVYLLENGHLSKTKACAIGANIGDPSPLDQATRVYSRGVMVISYIVPILAEAGVVGINGKRPNATWINL